MYNFKETEHKIGKFWKDNDIFAKSLESRQGGGKRFVFWEGPPTANGMPHIGHFLTRVYKDIYCRYKTMRGYYVLRKAGWDTHGLPVEIEVEKELGFKNKKEIEAYGIEKFNQKAKESVWKYKSQWEELTTKMGFWLDLKDPYITYEATYIESVWNVIKEANKKNLLYKAHKVVPFCTRCGTPLSSHEVAQGYETVTDRSVYIKFKLKSGQKIGGHAVGKNTYVLAWTTTPWTLPGNVALAVGKNVDYVLIHFGDDYLLMAKDLVGKVFNQDSGAKVGDSNTKGSELVGLVYEPLFEIKELQSEASHKVYDADFVSTLEGTGVVHTAVMYGEDDYVLGTKLGLPKFHTVNEQGKFQYVSKELDGKFVKSKEVEDKIIQELEAKGLLLKVENHEHEYPFCWRCSSPLLYYAKDSWFLKMSAVRDQIIKNNQNINWVPEHIKRGRFGQWLNELKDWAISRERYWGTPLPVWECEKCDNFRVVGSYDELERYTVGRKNKYFIVRHSLSTRNENSDSITISSDLSKDVYGLTEEGRKLVVPVADYLSHEHVDFIYASPFKRAKEAAEIIGKNLHVKVIEDVRLSEIKHDLECEGRSHTLCKINKYGRDTVDTKHDGGESWNDVRLRLMDFMRETEGKHKGKTIIIVTHADPILLLRYMSEGLSGDKITEIENKGERSYPQIASIEKINWKAIPRNEYGELDPHRPFIDDTAFRCPKCRANMHKVPDLMDVWFDSGSMPFAQWHWPFENKDIFKKQFPADFISEGIDQTRGWFYTLLAISTIMGKGAPYKNVVVNGHTLDEKGKKMSKSLGNVIKPDELMDLVGVDATRWYFYVANTLGENMVVAKKAAQERLHGFMTTLYNCLHFYELYKGQNTADFTVKHDLDVWIVSRLNQTIKEVTSKLDVYDSMASSRAIESFVVDDLSNWWLRRSRKRPESLPLLRTVLIEVSKLLAPFTPYIADEIYQRLNQGVSSVEQSVHLAQWPATTKRLIKEKLEVEMKDARDVITKGLALRKSLALKVRQPLRSVTVQRGSKFRRNIESLVKEELNVKKVIYGTTVGEVSFDQELDQGLLFEGYAREAIRQIQDMRKEAGYKVDQLAVVRWSSDDADIKKALEKWGDTIKKDASLAEFLHQPKENIVFDIEKESQLGSGKQIWLGLKK